MDILTEDGDYGMVKKCLVLYPMNAQFAAANKSSLPDVHGDKPELICAGFLLLSLIVLVIFGSGIEILIYSIPNLALCLTVYFVNRKQDKNSDFNKKKFMLLSGAEVLYALSFSASTAHMLMIDASNILEACLVLIRCFVIALVCSIIGYQVPYRKKQKDCESDSERKKSNVCIGASSAVFLFPIIRHLSANALVAGYLLCIGCLFAFSGRSLLNYRIISFLSSNE